MPDDTNAERQQRYRERKKEQAARHAHAEALARDTHESINRARVGRGEKPLGDDALKDRITRAQGYADWEADR
jgi:hypothetical protein